MKHKVFFLLTLVFLGGVHQTVHAIFSPWYKSRLLESAVPIGACFLGYDLNSSVLIAVGSCGLACVAIRRYSDFAQINNSSLERGTKLAQIGICAAVGLYYCMCSKWPVVGLDGVVIDLSTPDNSGEPKKLSPGLAGAVACFLAVLDVIMQTLF